MPESATHIQKAKVYFFFLISDSKPIARSSSYKVNQPEPTESTPSSVAYSDDWQDKVGILHCIGNLQPFQHFFIWI